MIHFFTWSCSPLVPCSCAPAGLIALGSRSPLVLWSTGPLVSLASWPSVEVKILAEVQLVWLQVPDVGVDLDQAQGILQNLVHVG